MSEMKTETTTNTAPAGRPWTPKFDDDKALTLDQALNKIKAEQAKKAAVEKEIDNLKEVAKALMKAKGLDKYTNPEGITARWSESQRSSVDKELAKELLGADWAKVESFDTVKSFTVK
jgi:hypothetical protein